MVGFTWTEITLFSDHAALPADEATARSIASRVLGGERGDRLWWCHRDRYPAEEPARVLGYLMTAVVFAPFVDQVARCRQDAGAATYAYRFDQETPVWVER